MANEPRRFVIDGITLQAFEVLKDKIFIEFRGEPPRFPISVTQDCLPGKQEPYPGKVWWIVDSSMSRTWVSDSPLNPDHQEKAFEIPVIERSAYDNLKRHYDKVCDRLEAIEHKNKGE